MRQISPSPAAYTYITPSGAEVTIERVGLYWTVWDGRGEVIYSARAYRISEILAAL